MAEGVNNTLQVLFCIGFMVVSESPDTLHFISKHFSTFRGGIHSPRNITLEKSKKKKRRTFPFPSNDFFFSFIFATA